MTVDSFSLGLGLPTPQLVLEEIIERAFHTHSTAALFGASGILTLGFLWRVIQEKLAFVRGLKDPDYLGHILMLIGCIALLGVYENVVRGIIGVVSQLGHGLSDNADLSSAFAKRAHAFGSSLFNGTQIPFLSSMSPFGLIHSFLQTFTVLLYGMVSWAVFALRCSQTFLLAVIIAYGPLCIGFSFLGGLFSHLSQAWFWALVEVSAWGLTLDVLNFVFAPLAQDVPAQFYLITELGLCITLLLLIRAVPQTTSMLLRSQTASFGANQLSLASAATGMMSMQRSLRTLMPGLAAIRNAGRPSPKAFTPSPAQPSAAAPDAGMKARVRNRQGPG